MRARTKVLAGVLAAGAAMVGGAEARAEAGSCPARRPTIVPNYGHVKVAVQASSAGDGLVVMRVVQETGCWGDCEYAWQGEVCDGAGGGCQAVDAVMIGTRWGKRAGVVVVGPAGSWTYTLRVWRSCPTTGGGGAQADPQIDVGEGSVAVVR